MNRLLVFSLACLLMHVGPLRQHATHADSVLELVARSLNSQVVQEEDELNRLRAWLEKLPRFRSAAMVNNSATTAGGLRPKIVH
jgi:hypothetical protein